MDKSPDAFRTISEVAAELDLPQHVLRFWETRFSQIKPMKRGGGRRYYRPEDVELLCGIRHLLYGEGYTIKGVQRILKEQGVRFVMDVWREEAAGEGSLAERAAAAIAGSGDEDAATDHEFAAPRSAASLSHDDAEEDFEAEDAPRAPSVRGPERAPLAVRPAGPADAQASAVVLDRRLEETRATGRVEPRLTAPARTPDAAPAEEPAPQDGDAQGEATPRDVILEDAPQGEPHRSTFRFMERLRGEPRRDATPGEGAHLSRDDIRRLQATLFELLECKRILDQAR